MATFGGGCFWCLEAVFEELRGVERVVSGYAGGKVKNPTYQDVCSGTTGHAEVVRIEFDPGVVTFDELLDVFFAIHDPTTLNKQGGDVGTQYRSIILYHDDRQKQTAAAKIQAIDASKRYGGRVVTQLEPAREFYQAEDYHQDYFRLNPEAGYCQVVIQPKMHKFRDQFDDKLK
ncbi:MAG: peptide-methionine (S)-S-oxide reductase MsrA [Candidatus Latescibacterota bacterium]|nr:MAG: peptide-methionine (S)-S-oxide reductase MsrA [Candidatus Latescibacterota bacterium]